MAPLHRGSPRRSSFGGGARIAGQLLLALAIAGCTSLTEPPAGDRPEAVPDAGALPSATAVRVIDVPGKATAPVPTRITVSHILIAYKGAAGSHAERSEDAARALASRLLAQIRKGGDFKKLADQYTDDPTGKGKGGLLGVVERAAAPPPFAAAAFALRPGEVSGVVQTPFGFHIIRRDQ